MIKKTIIVVIFFLTIGTAAWAAGSETDKLLSELPSDIAEAIKNTEKSGEYDIGGSLKGIFSQMSGEISSALKKNLACCAKLLAIAILCGAAGTLVSEAQGVTPMALNWAGVIGAILVGAKDLGSILSASAELLEELNVFSKSLIISLGAATAASGSPFSSAARQAAALFGADLLITLFSRILLPCVYICLAMRLIQIISDNQMFSRLSGLIRTAITTALKYILVIYFGYVTISGIAGSAADTLAKKTAKTVISSSVPIVGGIVSEAAESLFAGAAVLRSSIGLLGVIAIIALSAMPLISVGCGYLMMRTTSALSCSIDGRGTSQAIDAIADALCLIFAMCAAAAALLIITAVIFMKTAGY